MRWKKWAIGVSSAVAIAIPTALLITVAATPRPPKASNNYLLNFVDNDTLKRAQEDSNFFKGLTAEQKKLVSSQNYINQSIQLVDLVLNEYAKQGKNPSWNLQFASLNASPTNDELNFFQELTRAILYISQGRINFQLIPRTPSSVDQGFNKKGTQMVSWYWSPDYNGLGTWLGYNFSPDFIIPNLWPWLAAQLQGAQQAKVKLNADSWQESLASYLGSISIQTSYFAGNNDDGSPIYKRVTFKIGQIVESLKSNYSADVSSLATVKIPTFSNSESMLVPSVSQIYDFITKYNIKGTGAIYSSIQNAVSAWSMDPTNNDISGTFDSNGKLQNYKQSKVVDLINNLNYNPNMIPFIGDGPESKNPKLVRFGANAPDNPKTFANNRDWFLQADENGTYPYLSGNNNLNKFSWQSKADPFAQNITAWNPAFSENSAQLGKSVFTNLYTWTTLNNPTETVIDSQLVAEGTSSSNKFNEEVDEVIHWVSAGGVIPTSLEGMSPTTDYEDISIPNSKEKMYLIKNLKPVGDVQPPKNLVLIEHIDKNNVKSYTARWKFDFPIRPIQWVDAKGQPVSDQYLSPRDFWAGWKGYKVSCDSGLSSNSYFIDMLGVDMDTTLWYGEKIIREDEKSKTTRNNEVTPPTTTTPKITYTNTSETKIEDDSTWANFSIFLVNPTLPGQVCEDILTNQYFAAIPYGNEYVQNIVGEKSKIVYINGGKIDKDATFANNQIYGSGLATESYKNLWSAAPYYVKDCNQSSFTFALNKKYFEYFKKEAEVASTTTSLNPYIQFNLETEAPFGKNGAKVKIKKIDEINVGYLNYNIKTTFDQFKNGARDMAEIPSNEMPALGIPIGNDSKDDSTNKLTKDIYSPLIAKENKTNLIPYNTNIYTTTVTKQGKNIYQAQNVSGKNIDMSKWGIVPSKTDVYGNTIEWKPVAIDSSAENGTPPAIGDLAPIRKEHIPSQYEDLIVKNYNSSAKMSDLIDVFINNDGRAGQTINGTTIKGKEDILLFSSYIIRNTINNAINWLDMADICFPSNNKSPQLSFTPYGVFNTNEKSSDAKWNYYNLSWNKPWENENDWTSVTSIKEGTAKISDRVGGILKFTNDDYETASENIIGVTK